MNTDEQSHDEAKEYMLKRRRAEEIASYVFRQAAGDGMSPATLLGELTRFAFVEGLVPEREAPTGVYDDGRRYSGAENERRLAHEFKRLAHESESWARSVGNAALEAANSAFLAHDAAPLDDARAKQLQEAINDAIEIVPPRFVTDTSLAANHQGLGLAFSIGPLTPVVKLRKGKVRVHLAAALASVGAVLTAIDNVANGTATPLGITAAVLSAVAGVAGVLAMSVEGVAVLSRTEVEVFSALVITNNWVQRPVSAVEVVSHVSDNRPNLLVARARPSVTSVGSELSALAQKKLKLVTIHVPVGLPLESVEPVMRGPYLGWPVPDPCGEPVDLDSGVFSAVEGALRARAAGNLAKRLRGWNSRSA